MKFTKLLIAAFVLCFAINTSVQAQCRSVANEGISKLSPFNFNGQVNLASVKEGTPTEVHLSFYKGFYYKIQITYEPVFIGTVTFKVLTENKKEVFNNVTGNNGKLDFWVFYSNSPQNLILQISTRSRIKMHCVAVVVGMKVPDKDNHPM